MTDEICTKFALLHDDCITLLAFMLKKYANGLQKGVLEECNDIFQLDDESAQDGDDVPTWTLHAYLWSSPETWQQEEVADIDGKQNNVRIEYPTSRSVLVAANEDDDYLRKVINIKLGHGERHGAKLDVDHIRITLDNQPIYFHDHILDVRLVHVNFSLLAVGTHDLKVQVGKLGEQVGKLGEQGTRVHWLPVVRVVFDVIPPSIYPPSREIMKQDFQVPNLNEAEVGSSNTTTHWTSIRSGLLDKYWRLGRPISRSAFDALRLNKANFA